MLSQLNRQLAERQNADTQESTYLDLTVNTSDAAAAANATGNRDELYKNRSSRKTDS